MPREGAVLSISNVRSIVLGVFEGSILNVALPSPPLRVVTVHWSPLIVSLYWFTTLSGAFVPFVSIETIVHSPWSFSNSFLVSCAGIAAAIRGTTANGRTQRTNMKTSFDSLRPPGAERTHAGCGERKVHLPRRLVRR